MSDDTQNPDDARPRVTIAMPVYNAERFLPETLDAIAAQTFADWELVAVDDGSTDGSAGILRARAERDPRIRTWSRQNRGVVATRQEILAAARGGYLAVNDADDLPMPHRLAAQFAFLDANPEVLAVGSQMRIVAPGNLTVCRSRYALDHESIDAAHLSGGGAAMGHSGVMMRTAAARNVGGYRDAFARGAEDFDLWLRLAEHGRLANLPDLLLDYRVHEQNLTLSAAADNAKNTRLAVDEARARRGLPPLPGNEARIDPPMSARFWWARMALRAGAFGSARRLAFSAIREHPMRFQNWRMLGAALVGPAAPSVARWIRRINT